MQARCLLQFLHHRKRTCCICAIDDVSTPNLYRSYGRGNLSASQNLASEACVAICVTNMFLSRNWGATDIFGKKFNCFFNQCLYKAVCVYLCHNKCYFGQLAKYANCSISPSNKLPRFRHAKMADFHVLFQAAGNTH